jgi:tetratricopeptide (TPR) repeat protein
MAIALAPVAGALLFMAPAQAADQPEVLQLRASALAQEGRCTEALELLSRAGEGARTALLRGQCEIQLRRYVDAVASLESAKSLDPALRDVDLYLGIARFHQGDLQGAEEALEVARATSQDRAEFHLYDGLILLQAAESRAAAMALDRARELAPEAVEPTASYYAGLAWASADERSRAEASLERVEQLAPGSVWATEAEKARQRLQEEGPGNWWASVRLGVEYDDNVVLAGRGVQLPREISGTHDVRATWQLFGGYEFLRTQNWAAGVVGTYYGSAHGDLSRFNVEYPALGFYLDRRFSEATTARLRCDAGYAWVDGPFVFTQALTPTLYHEWGPSGRSQIFGRFYRYNYLYGDSPDTPDGRGIPGTRCLNARHVVCGPAGMVESQYRNRDGQGITAGASHTVPLGALNTELTGGYNYHRFSTRGGEWSYDAHEIRMETRTQLPLDFALRTLVSYAYRSFRNRSSYPDPRDLVFNTQYPLQNEVRRDDLHRYEIELEKGLLENLSTSVKYTYYKEHSNVAVFDYDREILGWYVTYRFRM